MNATQMIQNLEGDRFTMVPFGQDFGKYGKQVYRKCFCFRYSVGVNLYRFLNNLQK